MLVLHRKEEESLIITTPTGDEIEIVLIQAKRGSAKIGIIAPDDYDILRDELTEEYESVN